MAVHSGGEMNSARLVRLAATAALAGLAAALAGCGAAYYGAAIGIVASQKDKETTDTSFPDAVATDARHPSVATLRLSAETVTITRDGEELTDFEVLGLDFPAGYGRSRSNRDAGTTLAAGDELTLRLNDDVERELEFAGVATVGSGVAARIQAAVRGLAASVAAADSAAYGRFTASYDPATGSYELVSGEPGDGSQVVVAAGDPGSAAARLGLGVDHGGLETRGDEVIGVTVLNRGTDVIPSGTTIDLYLSRDKALDDDDDVLFGRIATDATVAVGEARRFTWVEEEPPERLLRGDLVEVAADADGAVPTSPDSGPFFVLFDVAASGGETALDDNTLVGLTPVAVYQPIDDPLTGETETAEALDLVITRTTTAISAVEGNTLTTSVTLANLGAAVDAAVPVDVDLVLSGDETFDEPASFADPAGAVAGVRVNPTDPNRAITVRIDDTGSGAVAASTFGDTVTVVYDGAAIATVQSMIDALAGTGLVDAFADGNGDPGSDALNDLVAAVGADGLEAEARDVFVASRAVSFGVADRPQKERVFTVLAPLREDAFRDALLPLKVFPLFRIRPALPGGGDENQRNDVRRGANFLRVYDRSTATFDGQSGIFLPTEDPDDFAVLDAVTTRPVNVGSITQGQQRVFRFEIPDTGLVFNEAQLLLILDTDGDFDPHVDLRGPTGELLTQSDDSPLGRSSLVYTPVLSPGGNRSLYAVVSSARFDESDLAGGSETFSLVISVNSREVGDSALVAASGADDLVSEVPQRYAPQVDPRIRNEVLIPFSFSGGKAEVAFVLPERARVRIRSQPVFSVSTSVVITEFVAGSVPSPVDFQAEVDPNLTDVTYRPAGGSIDSFHTVEAGVYTVAFEAQGGVGDPAAFRLEVDAEFLTDE